MEVWRKGFSQNVFLLETVKAKENCAVMVDETANGYFLPNVVPQNVVDAANYSLRTVRQMQPMWICILSHSWSEEAHEEKRNGYFLANVVLQCCWCSKPLSAGSHVSQIAIFFHVPLPLHHTPENTKFCHCILLKGKFQPLFSEMGVLEMKYVQTGRFFRCASIS